MINNPYIDKVKSHTKIIINSEDIYENKWKWSDFFGNKNDLVLEIWTWLWNFFSSEVIDNPHKNFIWMEIRYKRLYKTAEKSLWNTKNNDNSQSFQKNSNDNFIVLKEFWEKVWEVFWDNELSLSYIFFPDPWEKNDKTKKHRIISDTFLEDLYRVTKTWWKCIFKTDHRWYFDDSLEIIDSSKWKVVFKTYDYESENLYNKNKITEFEQIFRWQKLKVCYIELVK